ncbi:hypothetical protein M0208_05660 [Sphingomonas sp. SUN019]|uniref:hypothetical protein n=1 Tax=Sphingomonas sp. SUN019 TaxID=2937788 RepID=UPI00216413C6|nr:hypothetical protein [Sphingomonas sp. SUN019]UVO50030.1 hypothetical protein M0208_05660 [Sphingomonas sp. SUN019]
MSVDTPILRVLNGRLAGTERALPAAGTVSIGHQFWQDVVIRDSATKGIAVDLTLDTEARAQINVLEGSATLLGSTVEAGGTALLPPYVPFTIGGVALAWGDRDSDRWSDATGLVAMVPTPPEMPPSARDHALAAVGRAGAGLEGVFTRSRITMIVAVVGFLILASVAMPVVDALNLRGDPATRVERAMRTAGLTGLKAHQDGDRLTVTGVVSNEAQRAKATETLRGTGIDGTLAVQTSAELARAAADVARIQGLQAVARPIARTAVELRVTPLEPEQEQKLMQAVRGDVRGLTRLALRDDLPPVEEIPLKTVQDATKKVSTVVAGDPSFIQTVDGARYFAGAMMPSGHRLVTIQGNTVFLEKNGRETRLTF